MQTLQTGLVKNWQDLAKMALETGANGIQTYEDCAKTEMDDIGEWAFANLDAQTQQCINFGIVVAKDFRDAIKSKDIDKLAKGVTDLDVLSQHCMLE